MGLDDLYRNTKVMDIFVSSPLANGATRRATRIDTSNLFINESLLAILVVGASNLGRAAPGTVRVDFLQSPSTNTSSYTHIDGSTIRRAGPATIAATPVYATQRYVKGRASVIVGGTTMHFSLSLVGTGRVLPLST